MYTMTLIYVNHLIQDEEKGYLWDSFGKIMKLFLDNHE